jgi:hypothetical protein
MRGALGDDMGYPQQDDLAPLADAVREAYLTPPDEATQARHLAAMAEAARVIQHETIPARPKARGLKGDLVTRFRTAAPAVKLAALTVIGAFATGGLATAGVIDLPDSLPGSASDRANAVHDAIDGVDASETHPGTLIEPADGANEASSEEHGKSAEAQQNGADGAGRAFGDSVSDRESGGETKEDGSAFGDSVSEEAKNLVDHPEPQGSQETGSQETGETHSQQGQDIAESHGGGSPQD